MRPSEKNFILMGLVMSVAHAAIWFICFMHAWKHTSARFDNPDAWIPKHYTITTRITNCLAYPLVALWTPWMGRHMPNFLEWILFILNSALWGFGMTFIYCAVMRRKHRTG